MSGLLRLKGSKDFQWLVTILLCTRWKEQECLVQGTVQAVTDALRTLNSPQVFVNIIHVGVRPISESDLDLTLTCDACIVGFNVRNPPSCLSSAAARANIEIIKLHRVMYHLLEDINNLIVEKAPGTMETQVAGEAQVLSIFELKGRSKAKGDDVMIAGPSVALCSENVESLRSEMLYSAWSKSTGNRNSSLRRAGRSESSASR